MELRDKVAVVTGSAQGIGRAIAEKLACEGACVYILDYNETGAKETAAALHDRYGVRCEAVKCDISDVEASRKLVADVIEKEGRIDILVNNAGITQKLDVLDVTEEVWDRTFSVNLRGPFFFTQKVFAHMKEMGGGCIVNMLSLSAERGARFSSVAYTSSKGGLMALTKCLALLGSEYGIRVNGVAPGLIETAMAKELQFSGVSDVPMGRMGTPEDVAEAVRFLCTDRSGYMTGQILDVNGGQLMR